MIYIETFLCLMHLEGPYNNRCRDQNNLPLASSNAHTDKKGYLGIVYI